MDFEFLKDMTRPELNALLARIDEILEARAKDAILKGRQSIADHAAAVAADIGVDVKELMGSKTARNANPVAAKYSNPVDPTETWSGRGRRPKWVLDHVEAGGDLGDLAIASETLPSQDHGIAVPLIVQSQDAA